MKVIRVYSGRLRGKPGGKRVLIVPESLAEVAYVVKYLRGIDIPPQRWPTIPAEKFVPMGGEGDSRLEEDVKQYLPDIKAVPVLRERADKEGDYERYSELAHKLSVDIMKNCEEREIPHRAVSLLSYNPERLRDEWK